MSALPRVRGVRAKHEFIKAHRNEYSAQAMCGVIGVAPVLRQRRGWAGLHVTPREREARRRGSSTSGSHGYGAAARLASLVGGIAAAAHQARGRARRLRLAGPALRCEVRNQPAGAEKRAPLADRSAATDDDTID